MSTFVEERAFATKCDAVIVAHTVYSTLIVLEAMIDFCEDEKFEMTRENVGGIRTDLAKRALHFRALLLHQTEQDGRFVGPKELHFAARFLLLVGKDEIVRRDDAGRCFGEINFPSVRPQP